MDILEVRTKPLQKEYRSEEEAESVIFVARHNPLMTWHFYTLEEKGWGYNGNFVTTDLSVCMDSRFDKIMKNVLQSK